MTAGFTSQVRASVRISSGRVAENNGVGTRIFLAKEPITSMSFCQTDTFIVGVS